MARITVTVPDNLYKQVLNLAAIRFLILHRDWLKLALWLWLTKMKKMKKILRKLKLIVKN
jgi:hypothetical protein